MKPAFRRLMLAVAISALILQGCAQNGGTRPDPSQVVSVPVKAATTATSTSEESTAAAIPENGGKPVVTADTKDNFDAVAAAIRQEMQPGGRFAFVSKPGRQTVESGLTDMGLLFNQYGSVNKMDPAAHGRLLEDQNSINAVLARYDSNRRICWQETPVGTHFSRTTCRTLGEIQREKENGQHFMNQANQLQRQMQEAHAVGSNGGH